MKIRLINNENNEIIKEINLAILPRISEFVQLDDVFFKIVNIIHSENIITLLVYKIDNNYLEDLQIEIHNE